MHRDILNAISIPCDLSSHKTILPLMKLRLLTLLKVTNLVTGSQETAQACLIPKTKFQSILLLTVNVPVKAWTMANVFGT